MINNQGITDTADVLNFMRLSEKAVACLLVVFAALIVGILCMGTYSKKTILPGKVVSKISPYHIELTEPGYVSDIYVKPGDDIKKDEPLFSMRTSTTRASSDRENVSNNIVLRSPIDGVIGRMAISINQHLESELIPITILPAHTDWLIKLTCPSKDIGTLKTGDQAHIKYDAFPYQQYGMQLGKIISIEKTPVEKTPSESYYEIALQPERQCIDTKTDCFELRDGLQLSAIIEQEKRPLIDWLFNPLL